MDSDTFIIVGAVLGGIFIVLFVCLIWFTCSTRKQVREELAFPSKRYSGPTGDPFWKGTLPSRVDDYTEPRYVYENLKESCDYLPENGRIIGYRISPELVIHSSIHSFLNFSLLSDYISRYNGKLLNFEEVRLLFDNWQKVSQLREKAGDKPLKVKSFWALSEQQIPGRVNVSQKTYDDVSGFNDVWCALILKR